MEGVTEEADRQGPWARYAWIIGGVWIVFMGFPVSAAITADASATARTLATVLLVAYAAVYIADYAWMTGSDDWRIIEKRGIAGVAVMTALMIAAALLIGPGALGAGPFLVSLAMFSGALKRAAIFATGIALAFFAALTIVLALTPDGFSEYSILYMPPVIVWFSVGVVRVLMEAGERHGLLRRQRDLVAERERVARDVHDVLGHSLTVVTVKAELAERLIDIDPERAKAEIAQIRSLSREALAEVRATVSGLRVARLGDELVAARSALADAGIRGEVPEDPSVVDPRHRIVVAWVLREAITNVVRHSQATTCRVELSQDAIVVSDNGVGISASDIASGFRGLRERVAAAGGTLSVAPASPGTRPPGTRLEVRW